MREPNLVYICRVPFGYMAFDVAGRSETVIF